MPHRKETPLELANRIEQEALLQSCPDQRNYGLNMARQIRREAKVE